MQRREFLSLGASIAGSWAATQVTHALPRKTPVIDTHIHLFDPSRPGGIPWPEKTDTALYKAALPERYARIARPFGVVGAIVIEASPLASDNDWVLRVAANHPIIVGMVGDLVPGTDTLSEGPGTAACQSAVSGHTLRQLWGRDLGLDAQKPEFLPGLKMLAEQGLVLDSANPDVNLIRAISGVADHIPELRIVIDHLPSAAVPAQPATRDEYWSLLRQLAKNKNVFVKLSEVALARSEQTAPVAPSFNQDRLEELWNVFGEDHVLYASDWPNSDHHATYEETFSIVRNYVAAKGPVAEEKFFWKNSVVAYRWHRREPDQPLAD